MGIKWNIKRRIRRLKKINITWVIIYLFMFAMVLFSALPLIYMISTAFKPIDELFVFPPRFFVRRPTLQNFRDLILSLDSSTVPFTRYSFNSILVTAVTVTCTVVISSMGAYGLAKHRPAGSKTLFSIILAALMFSPYVTQISRYMVVNYLGMINTYWALIIPNIVVAYNLFLMKQFTEQFPDELLESARMDGANEWMTFWRIVMPSLVPAWSTLVVFSFVSTWNDYFSPLIFISSQQLKTLPLALQTIAGGPAATSIGRAGAVAAATFCMTMPTVFLFLLMQRKVMETMVYSGIKA